MSDSEFEKWFAQAIKNQPRFSGPAAIWNAAGQQLEVYLSNEEHYYEWIDSHLGVLRNVNTDKIVGVVFAHLDDIDTAVQNLQPGLPEYKSFLIYRQVVQAYKNFARGQVDLASLSSLLYLLFNTAQRNVYDEIERTGREAGPVKLDSGRQQLLEHFTGIL